MQYVEKAFFIFDDDSQDLNEKIESNEFGTIISSLHIDVFLSKIATDSPFNDTKHLVISVNSQRLSEVWTIAKQHNFSVAFIPISSQKKLIKLFHTSTILSENIEIALRDEHKAIDTMEINGEIIFSQGIIGRAPLIGRTAIRTRHSFFKNIIYGIKEFFSIRLQKFEITTENGKKINTAGSIIIILNHSRSGFLPKIFNFNQSVRDGDITAVIISPFSVLEYLRLITSIFSTTFSTQIQKTSLPTTIGYIKSRSLSISASSSKRLLFDSGKSIELPIHCKNIPESLQLNASDEFWTHNEKRSLDKETIKIDNLPDKIEAEKYNLHHIPFINVASEERFKDLFQLLRTDAQINKIYLFLMVLSTLLATIGLFANSTAVIIGAMLIAPLMTPIVSLSMGLLRGESMMTKNSLIKILIAVALALLASSLLSFILPYTEITSEMESRINPTLLDLAVAIISGVAAAFSKSFKEIIQNLTGVAIAVALVPPLATAGIGLGIGDIWIFFGAFLLFFTNLIGITLAAILTFYLLGFSNAVKSKKSIAFIFSLLILVSFPLYFSYHKIIEKHQISTLLKQQKFIINNKEIIVKDVFVTFQSKNKIIELQILVKESLNSSDFKELKKELKKELHKQFKTKLEIIIRVKYLL